MLGIDLHSPVLLGATHWLTLSSAYNVGEAHFATDRVGGFGSASLVLRDVSLTNVRDALSDWLMAHVTITDGAGAIAYEGLVAEMTCEYEHEVHKRRLQYLATRVIARYTYAVTRDGEIVRRERANDTDMQERYGVHTFNLDLTDQGQMSAAQASRRAALALQLLKDFRPFTRRATRARSPSIRLVLFPYWATLALQEIQMRWRKAKALETIVSDVLTSSGNQFIPTTDLSGLGTTGVSIKFNTKATHATPQDIIQSVIKYGDSASRRILFQVLDERRVTMSSVPTTLGAHSDALSARIYGANYSDVPAHRVRAGDYVASDVLGGLVTSSSADTESDATALLIESTNYDLLADTLEIETSDRDVESLLSGRFAKRAGKRKVFA